MNTTGYTKREILELIWGDCDSDDLCTAVEWLENETGENIADKAYTAQSIAYAIRAEDPSLLEEV